MSAVSIRELSHETSRTLRRVKAGETVEITERGTVIGRIVPAEAGDEAREQLVAKGRLKPATGDQDTLLASLDRRLATEMVDADNTGSATLQDMRNDERY